MKNMDKTKTILLVEDQGIIALSEAKMLQKYGYKVITVSDGKKAIETILASPDIDLVLIDIDLGSGMDGTSAAEIILGQRDLPLIFLSSHTNPEVLEKTEGITSYGYVVKGSADAVLIASIKMAFQLFDARMKEKEKEEALRKSETRWRTLIQNIPSFIAEAGTDGIIIALNRVQPGFTLEDYVGKSLFDVVAPESREQFQDAFAQALEKGELVEYEALGYGANRKPTCYHRQLVPIMQAGEVRSVLMVANDITERVQAEEAVNRGHELLTATLGALPIGVCLTDETGHYRLMNDAYCEIYEYDRDEMLGKHYSVIMPPDQVAMANEHYARLLTGDVGIPRERKRQRKNGSIIHIEAANALVRGVDGEKLVITTVRDITERKLSDEMIRSANESLKERLREIENLQEKLREQVIRDPLTDLFNRRYLQGLLEREISRARREKIPVSLIILDVDYFKRINDSYGHVAGDEMLRAIGEAIKASIRLEDIPCRYGGEEFLIVMPGASIQAAQERAKALHKKISELRVKHENHKMQVTISVGIAAFPEHGSSGEDVLIRADRALYQAKQAGRNRISVFQNTLQTPRP